MAIDTTALIGTVKSWLGVPYVFGGASRSGIDCSGLVQQVFKTYGVALPHHAQDQARYGTPVDKSAIQPGDLVFSDWGDGANSHVGIAVSPTQIIDAPHPGTSVRYDTLTPGYLGHVTAVRRLDTGSTVTVGAPGGGAAVAQGSGPISPYLSPLATPIDSLAGALTSGLAPLLSVGTAADLFAKLWQPTNIVRGVCFVFGAVLCLVGVVMLGREVHA